MCLLLNASQSLLEKQDLYLKGKLTGFARKKKTTSWQTGHGWKKLCLYVQRKEITVDGELA